MIRRLSLALLIGLTAVIGGAASSDNSSFLQVQNFVVQIYNDYAAQSFSAVHGAMHPQIRESVSETEYVEFQRQHFAKLNLELSDIEVGEVTVQPRLPRTIRDLVVQEENIEVFGVEISYRVRLESGVKLNQNISKTVY